MKLKTNQMLGVGLQHTSVYCLHPSPSLNKTLNLFDFTKETVLQNILHQFLTTK